MKKAINPQEIEKHLQEDLFDYFSNGSLIVDADFNIVYKKGNIPYLHFSDGVVSLNLFDNLDKSLHYDTRMIVKKVLLSNMKETTNFIQLESSRDEIFVQIVAQPFRIPTQKSMVLITFVEIEPKELILDGKTMPTFSESTVISTLSSQVAELETSNGELQSSNEELQVSLSSNKELQNKLLLMLESSMDGILGLDLNARHTFVNNKAAQMLGYSAEYLIGKESHSIWHHTKPDGLHYPESECHILSVFHEGKSQREEDLFWRKDGTSFPVELVRSPIIEDGKITGVVVNFHDISEKKELEVKVKREHEQMLGYLDISGLLIIILGRDAKIVNINEAGAKLIGLSKDEIIGLDMFDNFIDTKIEPEVREVFNTIINDKTVNISHHVNKIYDINKNEHLISWNNAKYKDENGKVIGLITTGMDITKEESLLSELQEVNEKYKQTFKAAHVGIAHIGLDGSWLDVNDYLCRLVGYTKEELLKLTFQDITHKDDLEQDLKYVNQILEGTINSYRMEKRYIRKNGDIVWINISVIVMRDNFNKPPYLISIVQDISQIKMLMFELEAKKNEFENIIRFAPNPIMIYAEDGTVIMINEAFSGLSGYTLKDIPTIKKWNENVVGVKNLMDKEMIENIFRDNVSVDVGQIKVISKNAKELIWIRSLAPLGNIYNDKRLIIYSATDITTMHEREEMMLAQSRQAAMGDMIGMIAHQWRQPLTVISMVGNNIRADLELGEEITHESLYEATEIINEQTQFLSHIIDDFRTFLKPEKEKEKVSLCDVYAKLRNMIGKTLENNEVALNFVNDCDIEFYTYTNELIQVFINLLNNSKDAFKERQIENAKIDITTTFDKKSLKIKVQDNAGGIDKSVINELGKPYVSTKSKNGTGLGLYMSKMILEKHFDGTIGWENCDGGSCFTINLPLL